eukprot:11172328-Lingulodinium_polyedra.AAC.1
MGIETSKCRKVCSAARNWLTTPLVPTPMRLNGHVHVRIAPSSRAITRMWFASQSGSARDS